MAERNPLEVIKKRYFKHLIIKKIYPLLFYKKCIKCGNEFCRESMYKCKEPSIYFLWSKYFTGCTHCFKSKEELKKYLEENGRILTEDDFITDGVKLIR